MNFFDASFSALARIIEAHGLGSSWERLRSWIKARGLSAGEDNWEAYATRPSPDMDPRDLRTELNWPVAD